MIDTSGFPGYVDLLEAGRIVGIHPSTYRRLLRQGKAPGRIVHGKFLIDRAALEQFKLAYDPTPGCYQRPVRRLL